MAHKEKVLRKLADSGSPLSAHALGVSLNYMMELESNGAVERFPVGKRLKWRPKPQISVREQREFPIEHGDRVTGPNRQTGETLTGIVDKIGFETLRLLTGEPMMQNSVTVLTYREDVNPLPCPLKEGDRVDWEGDYWTVRSIEKTEWVTWKVGLVEDSEARWVGKWLEWPCEEHCPAPIADPNKPRRRSSKGIGVFIPTFQDAIERMRKRQTRQCSWTSRGDGQEFHFSYIQATDARNYDGSLAGQGQDSSRKILECQRVNAEGVRTYSNRW